MFQLLKLLIIIWTGMCMFSLFSGCYNIFADPASKNSVHSFGSIIGMTLGFGTIFILWIVPTAIMGVIAFLIKPKQQAIELSPPVLCIHCGKYYVGEPLYCPNCGEKTPLPLQLPGISIQTDISLQTNDTKKSSPRTYLIVLVTVGVCLTLILLFNINNTQPASGVENSPPLQTEVKKTPEQYYFQKQLSIYKDRYAKVEGEIQKSAIYREQVAFLKEYLGEGKVQAWNGKITRIGTNEGGSLAFIYIKNGNVSYDTASSELGDLSTKSMIKIGTKVYQQLEKLKEGDQVTFSAAFIPDDKKGFYEISLLEKGFVDSPEFIVRFESIEPVAVNNIQINPENIRQVVIDFYNSIDRKNYSAAWNYLSDEWKQSSSYNKWVQGYGNNLSTRLDSAELIGNLTERDSRAVVKIGLTARDREGDGRVLVQTFSGNIGMLKHGAQWYLNESDVKRSNSWYEKIQPQSNEIYLDDTNRTMPGHKIKVYESKIPEYFKYINGRYAYSIDFPRVLNVVLASGNSDGVKFSSQDGQVELSVYGSHNSVQTTNAEEYSRLLQGKRDVGYSSTGSDWHTISWRSNGKIYYQKTFVSSGYINGFTFVYPAARKNDFEAVIINLDKTFIPGWITGYKILG